jgi:hypothetical protein
MKKIRYPVVAAALALLISAAVPGSLLSRAQERKSSAALAALVPQVGGWSASEAPRAFLPENLFEYIDGAAESYLAYDFRELVVAQFEKKGTDAAMTLEIYDMGSPLNAFGIFGAERYPENKPAGVGDLSYIEGESLNFMAGRCYVKLLGFGLGDATASTLLDFARKVAAAVPDKGVMPSALRFFPREGLVERSEKYIKKNFMGYEFLHDGYTATYRTGGDELECFQVEGGSEKDAEAMLGRLLDGLTRDGQAPEKISGGFRVKNRYGQFLFIGRAGRVLCGAMRVPASAEAAGAGYLAEMTASLAKAAPGRS